MLHWWAPRWRGSIVQVAPMTHPHTPPSRTLMRSNAVIVGLCLVACHQGGLAQARPICRGPEPIELATRNHPKAENWAALGGWFGEQHQFTCAIPAFRAALRIEPGSASLHYYLGLTLNSAGQFNAALPELRRSVELDPNQLQPRLLLGVVLNRIGRSAESQEAWEAALLVDPTSVIALDWLAKARISSGQPEAAVDLLSAAPPDEELTLDLAVAYSQSHLFDKAAETLNSALAKAPGDLRLSAALATVYVQAHRYQDATNLLRKALDLHPHDDPTELLYLRLLVLQDDDADARPIARRLLATHPDSFDALYLSGILENDAQEYAAASAHLKAAVAINPSHYDTRYNLGIALSHLQQYDAAREQLEKAVALAPNEAEAHFHLAQVLRALGQTAQSQAQLKVFQEKQQATIKLALAQTKASQAGQALNSGNVAQAVALYREAIDARPQDPILQYDLALALNSIKDPTPEDFLQQRAALEEAIQLKPGFAAAENQLGYVAAHAGDTAAAEQHFVNALAAVPRFAEASNNLGTLLGQEGRDSEAEVRFRSAVSANPRYIRAWVNLAATLASESHFPEARAAIESALKIDPQDPDALRLRQMLASAPGNPSSSQGLAVTSPVSSSQDQH
jgi:tetratricopeptide (TPR) repeat protein